MEKVSTIADIGRIEFNGEPVLTTEQFANAYETNIEAIRRNFNNNRERYVEGKHYYKLTGDVLRDYRKNFPVVNERAPILYLWTKRGCARHCKSVGTDTAWNVFEALEDSYFTRVERDRPLASVSDFNRGVELGKLAPHAKDPFTKSRIVAKAANLILGE